MEKYLISVDWSFQFLIVRLKLIRPPWLCERPLFQFLIVRLKFTAKCSELLPVWVSIPYSTIKILGCFVLMFSAVPFQFLIVRLKLSSI